MGVLVESDLSMICRQTTHSAILLSALNAANTWNKVLRNGDKRKRSRPYESVLVEAFRRLRAPSQYMRPDGNKFQRCQALSKSTSHTANRWRAFGDRRCANSRLAKGFL